MQMTGMPNLIELAEASGLPAHNDFGIANDEFMRLKDASPCTDEGGQPPPILAQSILSAVALCADDDPIRRE